MAITSGLSSPRQAGKSQTEFSISPIAIFGGFDYLHLSHGNPSFQKRPIGERRDGACH